MSELDDCAATLRKLQLSKEAFEKKVEKELKALREAAGTVIVEVLCALAL